MCEQEVADVHPADAFVVLAEGRAGAEEEARVLVADGTERAQLALQYAGLREEVSDLDVCPERFNRAKLNSSFMHEENLFCGRYFVHEFCCPPSAENVRRSMENRAPLLEDSPSLAQDVPHIVRAHSADLSPVFCGKRGGDTGGLADGHHAR